LKHFTPLGSSFRKIFPIREQDPLKQGLKPVSHNVFLNSSDIREQDPLKQGLKHKDARPDLGCLQIREQDPLKQGLKPFVKEVLGVALKRFESKIH